MNILPYILPILVIVMLCIGCGVFIGRLAGKWAIVAMLIGLAAMILSVCQGA